MEKEFLENWIGKFEADRKTLEQKKSKVVLLSLFDNLQEFKSEFNQNLNPKNVMELRVWRAVKDVTPTLKSFQTFFYADFGSLEILRRSLKTS